MTDLREKRILVVEDEALIATMVADMLSELGAHVVGPAHNIPTALDLVAAGGIDVALLDIDLNGEPCAPVVESLTAQGIPYIYATGYPTQSLDIPEGVPTIGKPYPQDELAATLTQTLTLSPAI